MTTLLEVAWLALCLFSLLPFVIIIQLFLHRPETRPDLKARWHKLMFLATCVLLTGLHIGLVPWAQSFELLLTAVLLAGIFIGCLDTASNSLVLYMLGPDRAPPFTQSLHAFVGMGFVLGSLIVRPFLPDVEDNS